MTVKQTAEALFQKTLGWIDLPQREALFTQEQTHRHQLSMRGVLISIRGKWRRRQRQAADKAW